MSKTTSLLRRVRFRSALSAAVEDVQFGASAGAGVALAVLFADRAARIGLDPSWAAASGLFVAAAFPAAGFLVRRTDDRALAASADERLGLRERISTALWARSCAGAGPMAALVVEDAEAVAGAVAPSAIARAFRPRLMRRPLLCAAALLAGVAGVFLWTPAARAVESPAQRAARLAESDRIAQVARKLEAQAKKVAESAAERKLPDLERLATTIATGAQSLRQEPPDLASALTSLNDLSEAAKAEARRRAGLQVAPETPEATERDRALSDLLKALSSAGLESLQKDLSEMEKRLREGEKDGGCDPESAKAAADELRSLAERVESLRRALDAAEKAGAEKTAKSIRTIGNEDVLEKIAQRMREIASKLDERGYEGLDSEGEDESLDPSEMSREELEQLLRDLEEMAAMEELSDLLRQGAGEARGGKKIRLPRPGGAGGT